MIDSSLCFNEYHEQLIGSTCLRCQDEEETINHVLFSCSFAKMAWHLSNILQALHFSSDLEENFNYIIDLYHNQTLTTNQKLFSFWLLWKIWKARNKLVFNKYAESPTRIVQQVQTEIQEWINNLGEKQLPNKNTKSQNPMAPTWTRPHPLMVKCNFDAGFDARFSHGTGGWIIRDSHGDPKAWGASKLPNSSTPLEAEAKALLMAMQQTWIRGFKCVQFEGDCEILLNMINGHSHHCDLVNLLQDIDYWTTKFSSVIFTFTFTVQEIV
ncbi:uncharacterized protein LOC110230281 [Arabidopsis lyrata subsp. lyrata]|uniref:uncharacterized protein LOC110230281 n=1 Tax=Arabidopsis lyrata subsp. lyrata TaxID=81972 RepID=UPI000A29A770|nr:uncharacterized protein LOC110230281 [Arabidopsis lyrata subsp. lyrata]|eukprot:XP_020888401.1 uncharacterized protein LOC110230281 [Arabidopsis lyrata subsp. lyrata]